MEPLSVPDLDDQIDAVRQGRTPSRGDILRLCTKAKEVLGREKNMVSVPAPVTIVGDIHGQFQDLLELFRVVGDCPDTNMCFLGDYVDRGYFSVECSALVLLLKVRWPARVWLLRGNHESRQVSQVYGFYDECLRKFGGPEVWLALVEVFDWLPLAASVDGRFFCPHAGLSPSLDSTDQIQAMNRVQEVPHEGPICDLVWSDPDDRAGWGLSPRGAGYTFGPDISEVFCRSNSFDMMVRAHQLVMDGYLWNHERACVTVFSAPNYCYRCGNQAAVMLVDEYGSYSFVKYNASPEADPQFRNKHGPIAPDYFL